MEDTDPLTFTWDEIAEGTTLSPEGAVTVGDVIYKPISIEVTLPQII